MTGRDHARLLGLFMLIYAGFQVVMLIFTGVIMTVMFGTLIPEMSRMPRRANEPNPEAIFGMVTVIMIAVLFISVLFLIPHVIAGLGLRKEKPSARIWAIIACVLACLNLPIGTALGVYGLWFIFGEEGKKYFGSPTGYNQPPPPNNWQ
jgi:hypothetical protein